MKSSSSKVSSAEHQERGRTKGGERTRSGNDRGDWTVAVRNKEMVIEKDSDRGRLDHPVDDHGGRQRARDGYDTGRARHITEGTKFDEES